LICRLFFYNIETDKVIGLFVSILLIFIIEFILICCLGFHKIFKIYPEEENNKKVVSIKMDYEQFKKDIKSMKVVDFMDKWEKHPKYKEYNQNKYDEGMVYI